MIAVNSATRWAAFLARHPMPFYAAHRGRQTDQTPENMAPENTKLALMLANANKTPSEFDVLSTKDKHIIVHHDYETGRVFKLPGQQKRISKITWDALKEAKLNIPAYEKKVFSITGKPYTSPAAIQAERIVELEEALDASPDTPLFIELKREKDTPQDFEKNVYEIVKKKGALDRVIFLSFNRKSLNQLRALDPNLLLMLNYSLPLPLWLEKSFAFQKRYLAWAAKEFDGVNPSYENTSKQLVDFCHERNWQIRPWVYQESRAEERLAFPQLDQYGVNGVITNAVDLARDYFEKKRSS